MRNEPRLPLFLFLLFTLAGLPVAATSYVMVPDEALVDQAPAAAVVRVEAVNTAAGDRGIATDYTVTIEQPLKGSLAQGTVRVRIPGGTGRGGRGLKIHGAPKLRVGERALLFLAPGQDGTYRLVHFLLGAFREVEIGGKRIARRNLAEATQMRITGKGLEPVPGQAADQVRDFDAFAAWVKARAAGHARPADYLVTEAAGPLRRATDKFTLFVDDEDGFNLRWFDFDDGANVQWRAYRTGQPGVPGGGYNDFQTALAAWNAEPQTPIDYRYAGTTNSTAGLDFDDGVNSILFDDPDDFLNETFSCISGGILALGGPFYFTDTTDWEGLPYHAIAEADIVINDGLSCFFAASPNASLAAQELFGHELGHTLGLGHACGDDFSPSCSSSAALDQALMRAFVHDDSRGAQLQADDRNGVRALYRSGSAPPPTVPTAPTGLTAEPFSTTEIELSWTDRSTNETAFRIEMKELGGTFAEIGTVGANADGAIVQNLDPATGYVFRVRASNAAGASAYTNEATAATNGPVGTCVPNTNTLCLTGGRFRVQVAWSTLTETGLGTVVPVTADDSGLFWFFGSENWEMLIKVLNGCPVNSRYWIFYAATTNVEYTVTVTDTQTGRVKVYFNPQGVVSPAVTDTSALATCP